MNIILIGAGKGGLIHYDSYKKLGIQKKIFVVDSSQKSSYIADAKIYKTIEQVIQENNLDPVDIIADIVVPKDNFYSVIQECRSLKIVNIIVEKPFILKNQHDFDDLNIVMVQNYLYSKIFNALKDYIKSNSLEIISIYSEFSKNRKENSSKSRGMDKKVVNCFNIEMPHQVYMVQDLLQNDVNLLYRNSQDMIIGDKVLKDHGSGLLVLECGGANCYLSSNLTSDVLQKNIVVNTSNNITIAANFFTYTPDLQVLKKGNVEIFQNGQQLKLIEFDSDDMFSYMLKDYIDYFESKNVCDEFKMRLKRFSNFYHNNNI